VCVCVCVCVWPNRSAQGMCMCMHTRMACAFACIYTRMAHGHTYAGHVHVYAYTLGTWGHPCTSAHSRKYARTCTCGWQVINIRVPEIVVSAVLDDGPGRCSSTFGTNQKGLSLKVFPLLCTHRTLARCSDSSKMFHRPG